MLRQLEPDFKGCRLKSPDPAWKTKNGRWMSRSSVTPFYFNARNLLYVLSSLCFSMSCLSPPPSCVQLKSQQIKMQASIYLFIHCCFFLLRPFPMRKQTVPLIPIKDSPAGITAEGHVVLLFLILQSITMPFCISTEVWGQASSLSEGFHCSEMRSNKAPLLNLNSWQNHVFLPSSLQTCLLCLAETPKSAVVAKSGGHLPLVLF